MNKTVIKIYTSFEEAEREDREYYRSLSPIERLEITENLRQNYYDGNAQGFPRVFEIIKKP